MENQSNKTKHLHMSIVGMAFLAIVVLVVFNFTNVFDKTRATSNYSAVTLSESQISLITSESNFESKYAVMQTSDLVSSADSYSNILLKSPTLEIARERKVIMKELAKKDPTKFIELALSPSEVSGLPVSIQAETEQYKQISGRLGEIHSHGPKIGEEIDSRPFIQNGDQIYEVVSTQDISADPGSLVSINGYDLDSTLVTNNQPLVTQTPPSAENLDYTRKTLVVLINFKDSNPPQFGKDEINKAIRAGGVINKAYIDQSYGKVSTMGDTAGWYTMPFSACSVNGKSPYDGVSELIPFVKSQLARDGFNLSNYNHIVSFYDAPCGTTNNVAGRGALVRGWFEGRYYMSVQAKYWNYYSRGNGWNAVFDTYMHEAMHNFGLNHDGSISCPSFSTIITSRPDTNCNYVEYGNYLSVIGNGYGADHVSADSTHQLRWLSDTDVVNVTTPGIYTINSIESWSGVRALRIERLHNLKNEEIYVEKRRNDGTYVTINQGKRYNMLTHSVGKEVSNLVTINNIAANIEAAPGYIYDSDRQIKFGPVWSTTSDSVRLEIRFGNWKPVLFSYATPSSAAQGQSVTLSWESSPDATCTATGSWSGSKPRIGSQVITYDPANTYVITCTVEGRATTKNFSITQIFPTYQKSIWPKEAY